MHVWPPVPLTLQQHTTDVDRGWCVLEKTTIMISEQVHLYVSNDNKEKLCALSAFDEIRSNTSKTILRMFPLIRYG